jgi:hypothetical protein
MGRMLRKGVDFALNDVRNVLKMSLEGVCQIVADEGVLPM